MAAEAQVPQEAADALFGGKRKRTYTPQMDEGEDGDTDMVIRAKRSKCSSPKFACPYYKHDPLGSPRCFAPTLRNQAGGCSTIGDLKYEKPFLHGT